MRIYGSGLAIEDRVKIRVKIRVMSRLRIKNSVRGWLN